MSRLRTALFINAHSRRASQSADKVVKDFSREMAGFEMVRIIVVRDLAKLPEQLKELQELKGLEAVIIGSGDGTIVSVLEALKGRDITYGFLPLGTSNTFMRSLGLPLTYPLAKRIIMKQKTRKASLGAVNGKIFANIAGIGLPVDVTDNVTNRMKKRWGPLAYVIGGSRALRGHEAFHCHVVNNNLKEDFYTHYLLFANGKYHGNLSLGKEISAYRGQLMLMAVGVSSKRRHFVRGIISFLLRRHRHDPQVKMIPFERLSITTKPAHKVEADGEIISHTPATVEILKDAITVFTTASKARNH